jgi:hypothetical protein
MRADRCGQHDRNQSESRNPMAEMSDVAGIAALTICESLLLALNDRNVLPEGEIMGILKDAANAHSPAPAGGNTEMHKAVAALITRIIDGGNSVRRT